MSPEEHIFKDLDEYEERFGRNSDTLFESEHENVLASTSQDEQEYTTKDHEQGNNFQGQSLNSNTSSALSAQNFAPTPQTPQETIGNQPPRTQLPTLFSTSDEETTGASFSDIYPFLQKDDISHEQSASTFKEPQESDYDRGFSVEEMRIPATVEPVARIAEMPQKPNSLRVARAFQGITRSGESSFASTSSEASNPRWTGETSEIRGREHARNHNIVSYIRGLLQRSEHESVVAWEDESKGVFRILDHEGLASLWSRSRGRPEVKTESIVRALRYYYAKGTVSRVSKQKKVYAFGPASHQQLRAVQSPAHIPEKDQENSGSESSSDTE